MTKHYCDKCGTDKGVQEITIFWQNMDESNQKYREFQLCPRCRNLLLKFPKTKSSTKN